MLKGRENSKRELGRALSVMARSGSLIHYVLGGSPEFLRECTVLTYNTDKWPADLKQDKEEPVKISLNFQLLKLGKSGGFRA